MKGRLIMDDGAFLEKLVESNDKLHYDVRDIRAAVWRRLDEGAAGEMVVGSLEMPENGAMLIAAALILTASATLYTLVGDFMSSAFCNGYFDVLLGCRL